MKIDIEKQSGIYTLYSEQLIASDMATVWNFFSRPENLNKITPEDMGFVITGKKPEEMYAGQIITYKIEILPMVKSYWVTEITHVAENKMFVDEQRIGPYVLWHHEHHFIPTSDGKVLMKDKISYKLPFGFLGNLLMGNIIKQRIKNIFQYRYRMVEELF